MVKSNFTGAKARLAEMAAETEDGKFAGGGAMTYVAAGWLPMMRFSNKVRAGQSRSDL
jgi:hypothetical protein